MCVCVQLHVPTALPPVPSDVVKKNSQSPSATENWREHKIITAKLDYIQLQMLETYLKTEQRMSVENLNCSHPVTNTRDSVRDSVLCVNNLQTNYVGRTAKQFSVSAFSKVCVARANATGSSNSHNFGVSRVPLTAVGFLLFLPLLVRHLRTCHAKKEVSVSRPLLGPVLQLQSSTFSLIVSTKP